MEQTLTDEVKVIWIFVAISNAGKLDALWLIPLIFQYFSLINVKIKIIIIYEYRNIICNICAHYFNTGESGACTGFFIWGARFSAQNFFHN